MFKKNTLRKEIEVRNAMESIILMRYYGSKGIHTESMYSQKEFPFYVSVSANTQEGYPKKVEISRTPKGKSRRFYKVVKKSFVFKLIHLKNEKSIYQKKIKKVIRSIKPHSGCEHFQSALDKNSNDISGIHFAIDFLFGKEIPISKLFLIDMALKLVS